MINRMMIILPTKYNAPLTINIDVINNGFSLTIIKPDGSYPAYVGGYENFNDLISDLDEQLPSKSKIRAVVELMDDDKITKEIEKVKDKIANNPNISATFDNDDDDDDYLPDDDFNDVIGTGIPMSIPIQVESERYSFDYKKGLLSFLKDQEILLTANKIIGQKKIT